MLKHMLPGLCLASCLVGIVTLDGHVIIKWSHDVRLQLNFSEITAMTLFCTVKFSDSVKSLEFQ